MVGLDTKKKMRVLDKVKKVDELPPDEAAEVFVKVSEIIRLIPVPKESLTDEGNFLLRYANDTLGKSYDVFLHEQREALLKRLLSMTENDFESINPSLREDIIELSIAEFTPDSRQDLIVLMERCIRSKGVKHFRTSIFNGTSVSQLQIEKNMALLCAEPFYLHPETVKEFDNNTDAANFVSNIYFMVLYAKKNNLYESEELRRNKIAIDINKRIYKLFVKGIKEKSEYIELTDNLKNGMFWEFFMDALKIDPLYKSLKNVSKCVLLDLGLDGSVSFTTLLNEGKFGFDARSVRRFHELKGENNEAAFYFINSLGSMYYELQRMFAGNDVTVDEEFETVVDINKLWPVEIFADCIFDFSTKDGMKEFIGLKRLNINFKDDKYINIQKTEESFKRIDPVSHSLLFLQTHLKDNIARFDFYFSPEVHKLLYILWRDKKIDETVIGYINTLPSLVAKPFSYVKERKKEGIVGYFEDLKIRELEVKK